MVNKEEKTMVVPVNLMQAILNYLKSRPYVEVYPFIDTLRQLDKEQTENEKVQEAV